MIKVLDAVFQALEEFREELATKYDLLNVRNELREEIANLRLEMEKRFNRLHLVLIGLGVLILGTNPTLLELLGKLLGILPK